MNQKLWLMLPFTELGPNLAPAEAAGRQTMLILSSSWNWPSCCILKRGQLKEMQLKPFSKIWQSRQAELITHLEHIKNAACPAASQHLEQVTPSTRQALQGKLLKKEPQWGTEIVPGSFAPPL